MPELPEVEVVRRTLLPRITGRRLGAVRVRERRLRVPVDTRALRRTLPGRRVLEVRRRAKYLLIDLEADDAGTRRRGNTRRGAGPVLLVHLGMTGRLGVCPESTRLKKHDHVIVALEGGDELRFNDARRFGLFELIPPGGEECHPRLVHLGIEPLGRDLTAARLRRAANRRSLPVKNFLMDGRQIVGVGNIYASESLWRAGIHPARAAGRLSVPRWQTLVKALRKVLRDSIAQGGTTISDFAAADGTVGYFSLRLDVYDREGEPCRRCGRAIRRIVQSGRSTFYCPGCQR